MRRTLLALTMLAMTLLAQGAAAAAPAGAALAPPILEPAIQGTSRQYDFTSKLNGSTYRVQIFVPRGAPPKAGFPTLYVLDGDALFGTFAEAVRMRAQAGELAPAVVVGIAGAPGGHADRSRDFSPSDLTPTEKTIIKDMPPEGPFGGAETFLSIIQTEIKPGVAALAAVDPNRSMLFGWSLGGQFVVHTVLHHPESFQTYLALSPSLWWGGGLAFRDLAGLEQRGPVAISAPALFIGVGNLEQTLTPGLAASALPRAALVKELAYCRMVDNARDFAGALHRAAKRGAPIVTFRVFEGQTHNSVPWAAIDPVLTFALARRP